MPRKGDPMIDALKNRLKSMRVVQPMLPLWRVIRERWRKARAEQTDLPHSVSIELTNECNLKCLKCPTYEANRSRGMMSQDLYQKILDDIQGATSKTELALSGGGEAILHEEFVDFVAKASSVPNITTVGFATNGLDLHPDVSKRLLDVGLRQLKVSLDAVDATTYLKINRVDGYTKVVENVKRFCQIRNEGNYACRVTLKVTLYKEDEALVQQIRDLWSHDVDVIRVTGMHNWAGLRGNRVGAEREDACPMPWEMVQILWNGQITLCCFDSMEGFFNMGNVRDVNISDYWRYDKGLSRVRKMHLAGDFSDLKVCGTCNEDQYVTRAFFSPTTSQSAEPAHQVDW